MPKSEAIPGSGILMIIAVVAAFCVLVLVAPGIAVVLPYVLPWFLGTWVVAILMYPENLPAFVSEIVSRWGRSYLRVVYVSQLVRYWIQSCYYDIRGFIFIGRFESDGEQKLWVAMRAGAETLSLETSISKDDLDTVSAKFEKLLQESEVEIDSVHRPVLAKASTDVC